MAIKDIIVPSFVGTSTVKWIVTRGFASSDTTPDVPAPSIGDTWHLPSQDKNWSLANLCKNWELPSLSKIWSIKRRR